MNYKALWKDTFREIPKSIMRFLAILIIIFLGVGFYVGISATSPDMISTVDEYFKETNLRDFHVQSTYGLTTDDINALNDMDDITTVGQYAYDFYVEDYNQTIRLYSYDADNGQTINKYQLETGRLPENPGEIALDTREVFLSDVEIGDQITLATGESNGEPEEHLTQQTFEVVGFVNTPLYITHASRGFTTIGGGTLAGFGVILESDYDTDFYSEANLVIDGNKNFEVFSDEYEAFVDPYDEKLTDLLSERASIRTTTILEDAQTEIDDGWTELEEGEQELADAEQELTDARAELDDGWAEYQDGRAEFEAEIADAEAEIDRNEVKLQETIQDLKNQRQDLINQRADLQAQLDELNASEPEINAALDELDSQEANLMTTRAQLIEVQDGLNELDTQMEQVEAAGFELEEAFLAADTDEEAEAIGVLIAENEMAQATIRQQREQIEQAFDTPGLTVAQVQGQISAIDSGLSEITETRTELETTLSTGRDQLRDGINQITAGIAQLDEGLEQANAGYDEIEEARNLLETETIEAQTELDDALRELEEAEVEYTDGLATFEEERETALDDLAEGRADLEEAEADLAELEDPDYFSTRRSEDNTYIEYKDNTDRLAIIAAVFPVFFFLIAIFISFTTMTRMVDEEREFIGIMKALGYPNRKILTKFITYSVLATTLGTVLGLIAGYTLIPMLIFFAYGSMYNLPSVHLKQYTTYTIIATVAAFASTVGASLFAVRHSLKSNAATLLQPKAPKSGTHIWLEKFPFIWERLSFNYKITFRNVFRYKSRMFMTIFGVAGSTGLVLTGFGISDSISSIPDTQYTELNHFQAYVALNTTSSEEELEQYLERVEENEEITDSILTFQESITIERDDVNTQEGTIFVPMEPNQLEEFVTLRHFDTGEIYTLDDAGAYITQKLAQLFDIGVGDTLPILNADDEEWTVEVAGIVENYVGHIIYMSPNYYESVTTSGEIEPSLQLVKFDTDAVDQNDIGRQLIEEDTVAGITYATDVYDAFSDTLSSLELITQILVVAAAALAFIVLYNLTNINVSERERELSTIKVLGFHDFEVTMYIYRENIILTFLGILFGCLFGTVLQRFIMTTMEVDSLVFGKVIHMSSYLYSIVLTIIFTLIVMVVIHFQLKRIDMVEALKAND